MGARKRRWARIGIALLVAAAAVLGIAWYLDYFENHYDFRSESEEILTQLTGGEETATLAYEKASFPFRETSLLASFVDRADRLTKTLGTFVAIESVEEIERLSTLRGKTARIVYELRFSGVTTRGELSYLRGRDDKWRMLGFSIKVPLLLEEKVKRIDSEYERIKAPDAVVVILDEVLQDIAEGRGAAVRKAASRPFRESKSEEEWTTLLAQQVKELGPFQRRLAILSSGQNAGKSRAKISALLQYDEVKTTGTFEFIKVGEDWRLLKFKVVIPEQWLPER